MRVRPARVEDAAALAEVHVRSWQAAYAHVFGAERLAGLDVERRVRMWKQVVGEPEPRSAVFVAADDERLLGFASIGESRESAADGELYGMYALPEAWGTGAGKSLMDAAIEALRSEGFRAAVLWVLEDNPRARRFYEREGWSLDGARREGEHLGVATPEIRYRITLA